MALRAAVARPGGGSRTCSSHKPRARVRRQFRVQGLGFRVHVTVALMMTAVGYTFICMQVGRELDR